MHKEFDRRRARNPRYSLRAFARQLGTHHSTISRILNEGRRLTSRRVRSLGPRLGLNARQVSGACLHENMALVATLAGQRGFRPNSRWISTRTGLPLDDVNVALHYLIPTGKITMTSATAWTKESAT